MYLHVKKKTALLHLCSLFLDKEPDILNYMFDRKRKSSYLEHTHTRRDAYGYFSSAEMRILSLLFFTLTNHL